MSTLFLLALLACGGAPEDSGTTGSTGTTTDSGETGDSGGTTTLSPEEMSLDLNQTGHADLLLPTGVVVDPQRGRGFAISLSLPLLAEFNINNGTLTAVHDIDFQPAYPRLSIDGDGVVWVSNTAHHPGFGLNPDTGEQIELPGGFDRTSDVIGLPGGGAVYAGVLQDGTSVLRAVAPDGHQTAQGMFEGELLRDVELSPDGVSVLAVSEDGSARVVGLNLGRLEEQSSCPGARGGSYMARLPDGSWMVSDKTRIVLTDCLDEEPEVLAVGKDNHQLFVFDEEVIVLDRQGVASEGGESWGVARRVTHDLELLPSPIVTGKNSGFGGYDHRLDTIWMNSEGTSEVWGVERTSGEVLHRVSLGTHLDTLVVADDTPHVAWVTGRLSSSLFRADLESGEVLSVDGVIDWPVGPTLVGGSLWVVDGLTGDLFEFDRTSMALLRRLELGLHENPTLAIDDLLWNEERQSLFLTHGVDNTLYEIDPTREGSEAVIGSWRLTGELVGDSGDAGLVEVALDGGLIYVARLYDGALSVVNPDEDELVASATVETDVLLELGGLRWDLLFVEGETLYLGPFAFDTTGLRRTPEHDVAATHIIGRLPEGRYGWSEEWEQLVLLDENGGVLRGEAFTTEAAGEPVFAVADWDAPRALHVGFGSSKLTSLPLLFE